MNKNEQKNRVGDESGVRSSIEMNIHIYNKFYATIHDSLGQIHAQNIFIHPDLDCCTQTRINIVITIFFLYWFVRLIFLRHISIPFFISLCVAVVCLSKMNFSCFFDDRRKSVANSSILLPINFLLLFLFMHLFDRSHKL